MGAPAARVYELSREWVRLGHAVQVLTGFPNHPTGVIPEGYRGELLRRETVDGIEVCRAADLRGAEQGPRAALGELLLLCGSRLRCWGRYWLDSRMC